MPHSKHCYERVHKGSYVYIVLITFFFITDNDKLVVYRYLIAYLNKLQNKDFLTTYARLTTKNIKYRGSGGGVCHRWAEGMVGVT